MGFYLALSGYFKFYVVGNLENCVVRENEKHDYQSGDRAWD